MANGGSNFKNFLNMVAFVGVIAVACALLFGVIFSGNNELSSALSLVAQCIAYLVTAIYAFYFVYSKRNAVLTIVYIIAVVAIVVLLII